MGVLHDPKRAEKRPPERQITDDDLRRIRAAMSPVHRLYREGVVAFGRPRRVR